MRRDSAFHASLIEFDLRLVGFGWESFISIVNESVIYTFFVLRATLLQHTKYLYSLLA